jgi:hypothetical protein
MAVERTDLVIRFLNDFKKPGANIDKMRKKLSKQEKITAEDLKKFKDKIELTPQLFQMIDGSMAVNGKCDDEISADEIGKYYEIREKYSKAFNIGLDEANKLWKTAPRFKMVDLDKVIEIKEKWGKGDIPGIKLTKETTLGKVKSYFKKEFHPMIEGYFENIRPGAAGTDGDKTKVNSEENITKLYGYLASLASYALVSMLDEDAQKEYFHVIKALEKFQDEITEENVFKYVGKA